MNADRILFGHTSHIYVYILRIVFATYDALQPNVDIHNYK